MATLKATVKQCDVCGTKVSDEGAAWIGGHPHAGWLAVEMRGGPTNLEALRAQRSWDLCGWKCLNKLSNEKAS